MDTFTKEQRSRVMGRIRSTNTQAEIAVRRILHRAGYRFRLHSKVLPGKPDIVLPKYRAAIFVHGCFWHGHHCKDGRRPKSNTAYWEKKLGRNIERDAETAQRITSSGWKHIVVWACEIGNEELLLERLRKDLIP